MVSDVSRGRDLKVVWPYHLDLIHFLSHPPFLMSFVLLVSCPLGGQLPLSRVFCPCGGFCLLLLYDSAS